MKKLLAVAALAFGSLTLAACTQPVDSAPAQGEEVSAQSLAITEETETSIVGSYASADSFVTFESRLESPVVRTKLVVNGAAYDFSFDVVESTLDIDGHSNTVLAADAEILRRLEKSFDKAGNPTKIREQLFKTISLMSAAPRGTTVITKHVNPNAVAKELDRGTCDYNDGITYLCGCNTVEAGCSKTFMGWSGSNPLYQAGGVSGTQGSDSSGSSGKYVTGCASTPGYTHEHEVCEFTRGSSYHGRYTWAAKCGWSAGACEGRCGAGCPNSYNFYITKDCLDHDVCLNNHPSAASNSTFGDCGNEWDSAAGDFTSGTSSGFASSCGAPMWGETTR